MPRVFISYRRTDTAGHAGRLAEALGVRYGHENVFIDVDAIAPGEDFRESIRGAVAASDVALVLIGEKWLEPSPPRRIDDPQDVVRQEVAAALALPDPLVVPVLVEDARIPAEVELPEDVRRLAGLNAFELSNKRWRHDLGLLLETIEQRSGRLRRAARALRNHARTAALLAVLVATAATAAILLTRDDTDSAAERAEKVAACQRTHGLATARQQRAPRAGESQIVARGDPQSLFVQRTFSSCDWPPPPGADPDGYRAVTVTSVQGPGQDTASGQDVADRIESRCGVLVLEYQAGGMGYFENLRAFRARPGEVWGPDGSRDDRVFSRRPTGRLVLPFYPSREEVVVLHSNRSRLDRVTCAR